MAGICLLERAFLQGSLRIYKYGAHTRQDRARSLFPNTMEAHSIYEHALALLFWKQVLTPRSYNSSRLFHSEKAVWMSFELSVRTKMSIPAYSTGSPGLSVLECNRQLLVHN